jgi:ADP-ribosylglycohydrolase
VSDSLAPFFQIEATGAVSAALWALICHWDAPSDAVVAAIYVGGDTDTLASMTGALGGALHGAGWIPQQWWAALENGEADGRDAALAMAGRLAQLDCREAVEPWDGGTDGTVATVE